METNPFHPSSPRFMEALDGASEEVAKKVVRLLSELYIQYRKETTRAFADNIMNQVALAAMSYIMTQNVLSSNGRLGSASQKDFNDLNRDIQARVSKMMEEIFEVHRDPERETFTFVVDREERDRQRKEKEDGTVHVDPEDS